jgi:predicted nuclease of restriction endonuclease-like (RecB) superfamily
MNELENINFNELIQMIETRRSNAYKKVNEELIALYWDFGKYISEKLEDGEWGSKIVDRLVEFMKREYPTLKGFNRRGIYRMKQISSTPY